MAGRIKGIMDFVAETIKDAKYDRAEFDPRFYPGGKLRVKDSPEYRANVIDTGTMIPQERIALQDLEGRPYFTTMSDRTAAGGLLEGIGNKPLAHPIRLTGGQDYMRDDTGELWASGAGVVPNMVKAAKELKDQYGSSPVFMPWRMAPSGGDFAHMTGQTMLSWAAGNMPKVYKKQLDADMKKFVPDWAGVDDPKSLEQYGTLSDTQRKTAMNMLDKEYRNKGGISQTQARLAVSDQSQLLSPVSGFQNVGEVDLQRGVLEGGGNATYPSGLAGDYLGTLDTDVTAMDLNPERYARALKKDGTFDTGPQGPDSLSTRSAPRRAMEVGYWGGLIDEALLRRLSEEGFKVNSGLLPGVATAGVAGASLLGSEDADASVAKLAARGMELVDLIDPEDSRVGEYFLRKGGDTKSIGSLKTDYAIDSGFDEGYMSSLNTEIDPGYRRQGLAGEMYDAAEEISGNKLVPSTHLSMDGAHMWNARDSKLLREVHEKMGAQNYNQVEDILYPEGRPSPNAIKLRGFKDRVHGPAGVGIGASMLPLDADSVEEYTEAPVIEEQSFGSMIQEYGDINRRAKAADDKKFGLLMAERSDRAGMSRRDRRGSPASPELQEFTKANVVPSLLQFASGVGEGGVDYLKDTFSGGGYVTAPAYASQQYEDINRDAMMSPEEAKAPLRPEQIYLDPRMAEEAERLRRAGMTTAGILSMLSPI